METRKRFSQRRSKRRGPSTSRARKGAPAVEMHKLSAAISTVTAVCRALEGLVDEGITGAELNYAEGVVALGAGVAQLRTAFTALDQTLAQ